MTTKSTEQVWDAVVWIAGVIAPVAVWWLYAHFAGNELIPTPLEVIYAFGAMTRSGELPLAIWQSAQVLVGGFLAGAVPGLLAGMLIGRFPAAYVALDPYISALYAVPTIALVPILIVAIGWGNEAKIVIIALLVFLPVCINSTVGMRQVSHDLLEMAHSFCSTEAQTWRDVYIASALPAIVPGLRIGVGRALTGLIVAEFSTAITGLGNLIQTHSRNFEVANALVPVMILLAAGYCSYTALDTLEARLNRSRTKL